MVYVHIIILAGDAGPVTGGGGLRFSLLWSGLLSVKYPSVTKMTRQNHLWISL